MSALSLEQIIAELGGIFVRYAEMRYSQSSIEIDESSRPIPIFTTSGALPYVVRSDQVSVLDPVTLT